MLRTDNGQTSAPYRICIMDDTNGDFTDFGKLQTTIESHMSSFPVEIELRNITDMPSLTNEQTSYARQIALEDGVIGVAWIDLKRSTFYFLLPVNSSTLP